MSNTFIIKKTIKAKHAILNRKKELTPEGDHCGNDLWMSNEMNNDPKIKEASIEFWRGSTRYGNKRKFEAASKRSDRKSRLLKEEREAFRNEINQELLNN